MRIMLPKISNLLICQICIFENIGRWTLQDSTSMYFVKNTSLALELRTINPLIFKDKGMIIQITQVLSI